jgi:hypothetical protein
MNALKLIINDTVCLMPVAVARELAARLRRNAASFESPALAVAVLIETCCDEVAGTDLRFTDREETELAWTVHAWKVDVGYAELPAAIMRLRDALGREAA